MKQSPSKNYVSIKLKTEECMEKIKNGCPEYVELLMQSSFMHFMILGRYVQ